jgi:acetyltransferase-like isoleucine patch superfamily enzyme
MGRNTTVQPPCRVDGEEHVALGDRVFVGSHSWIQVIEPQNVTRSPVITIGDDLAASGFLTITAARSVTIEKSVTIARYVYISDHSHEHSARDVPIGDQGITDPKPVRICEGAWLGQGAVICPGVTIGRNAIVGANAVVATSVPDFCVAVGAPARIIRAVD